jgi:AcrR family transcriptional regulator
MTESARRERILRAAERLFSHYGPGKTTIADIARACGIGVGSVYLDFPSKDALLAELSDKKVAAVASRMRAAARSAQARDRIVEMLEARVVAFFELARESQHGCELVRCRSSGEAGGPAPSATASAPWSFGANVRALVVAELRGAVEAGEIASCDPDDVIGLFEVAFAAFSPPLVFRYEQAAAVALARRLAELLVTGLSSVETTSRARRAARR